MRPTLRAIVLMVPLLAPMRAPAITITLSFDDPENNPSFDPDGKSLQAIARWRRNLGRRFRLPRRIIIGRSITTTSAT